jgi:transposase InsO family protein
MGTMSLPQHQRQPDSDHPDRRGSLSQMAYVRTYRSDLQRADALDRWLHTYNHHRCHTALNGQPPMSRINNEAGPNS